MDYHGGTERRTRTTRSLWIERTDQQKRSEKKYNDIWALKREEREVNSTLQGRTLKVRDWEATQRNRELEERESEEEREREREHCQERASFKQWGRCTFLARLALQMWQLSRPYQGLADDGRSSKVHDHHNPSKQGGSRPSWCSELESEAA